MRCGNIARANIIKICRTALDARKIGKLISTTEEFDAQRVSVMREILEAKALQVTSFRDALKKSNKSAKFFEATFDNYWGAGIDARAAMHIDCEKWPGKNVFMGLISDLACKYRRPARSWSTP